MKKREIVDRVDPIQRLIDYQLRSIWRAHQLESTRKQVRVADTPRSSNTVEDMFIDALDRKYSGQFRMDMIIFDYVKDGYSYRDVESIIGVSRSGVGRSMNRIVTLLESGELKPEDL